jgi:hypothetical protein
MKLQQSFVLGATLILGLGLGSLGGRGFPVGRN